MNFEEEELDKLLIFDLDGTMADCSHRLHHIEGKKKNWRKFFDECDKDRPIEPVINIWDNSISLGCMGINQIWTGRCESVREKTEKWLFYNLAHFYGYQLKMRPEGDCTPDDKLKENWLLELDETPEAVFEHRPEVINMFRKHWIFVFDCNQRQF